ncbi:hypothetical protein ABW19_dt0207419 [Dactylella cylindrospora]|nr:hypothetical protein ABW19_dt0207419 [Dactylella cylindrospora]
MTPFFGVIRKPLPQKQERITQKIESTRRKRIPHAPIGTWVHIKGDRECSLRTGGSGNGLKASGQWWGHSHGMACTTNAAETLFLLHEKTKNPLFFFGASLLYR